MNVMEKFRRESEINKNEQQKIDVIFQEKVTYEGCYIKNTEREFWVLQQ